MRGDVAGSIAFVLLTIAVIGLIVRDVFRSITRMLDDLLETVEVLAPWGAFGVIVAIAGFFLLQIVKVKAARDIEISRHVVEIHKDQS